MLSRLPRHAALVAALFAGGCKSSSDAGPSQKVHATEVVGAGVDAQPLTEVHGTNRIDPEDLGQSKGGFAMFKEAWVYLDGMPVGILREVELPPLPETWVDEIEYLDFNAGDPGPHERVFQVRRWKLADYFEAIGIDLKKIKQVAIHGGRGSVLVPGDAFRKKKDEFLFDLTGTTEMKLRVWLPMGHDFNTSFDRYAAVSVIVDKPALTVDEENDLVLDGVVLEGIPFYGQPLRGGIRVYLDGKLAIIIKRNSLGDEGRVAPGKDEWSIPKLMEARGLDPDQVGAADLLDAEGKPTRLESIADLSFQTSSQAQGAILMSNGQLTNAIQLWTKGKVPPVRVPTPKERDKK